LKRRAAVGLITAGVTVLALLTVFAIELSDTQAKSRQDVISRVHERSSLAAALIQSLLSSVAQERRLFEVRYGGRVVRRRLLDEALQQSAYLVLMGRHGRVLAASHGFPAQARRQLPQSLALASVRGGRSFALGNLLSYRGNDVVNLAVAFPTRYGRRYLVTGVAMPQLAVFLRGELSRIPGVAGAHNYVIDANDAILASTNPQRRAGDHLAVPPLPAGEPSSSGELSSHYFDETPIPDTTWRVVLAAPNGPLFASVSGLRKLLPWLIFAAFALVAGAALLLGQRVLRSAGRDLETANLQLGEVNEQLEAANATLAYDALHDPLTGLPNRALVMDRLNQMLERAGRDESTGCAVLFIDLDGFKLVNDSLGHAVGDQLLIALADRFRLAIRPGDTVARIGGDEFVVLLDGVRRTEEALAVVDRVQNALANPIEISSHRLFVRASIGIALSSSGIVAADLVRNADIAMYEAKRRGPGTRAVFDQAMRRRVVDRLGREDDLRRAISESLLPVHYQPIIDLADGRIRALEALARWPEDWSHVAPAEFVRIAEESGLIGALGQHVLRHALESLTRWRAAGLVSDETCVSVNLSPRQLDDPELPGRILADINAAGLPGDALRLEITESTLVHEAHQVQRLVSEVCSQGVGLHLDDFGTQYSSLAALQQYPVAALKIDHSLVASMVRNSDGEAIVRGIVALAHGLGLGAIAEGIEEPEELRRLQALDCNYGQGFLFAKPLSREHTEAVLAHWSPAKVPGWTARLTPAHQ
jgi:diguanylate cyclase (GGDEF)-like protein